MQAIYLIFLLGWFLTLFIWTRGVAVSASERFHAFPLARPVVIGLLALSLIATRQFGEGLIDALYRAPQAGRQWESRDRELRQAVAEGKTTRVVPRIRRWPYVYPRYEISREPTDPINRVLADYYGLKSLAAETE